VALSRPGAAHDMIASELVPFELDRAQITLPGRVDAILQSQRARLARCLAAPAGGELRVSLRVTPGGAISTVEDARSEGARGDARCVAQALELLRLPTFRSHYI